MPKLPQKSENIQPARGLDPESHGIDPRNFTRKVQGNTETIEGFTRDRQAKLKITQKILASSQDEPFHVLQMRTVAKTELPRSERKKIVKELSARGLTQMEIAQELGVSQGTVSNDLRSARSKKRRTR